MLATFANTLIPIFGEYIYIGGGLLTLVLVVLVILYLVRRV